MAVVSKELISRNSSLRGWCEMVLHSFVFDLLFQSAKESPEHTFFVICSLILHVLKFAGFRIVGKMYNLNGLKFVFSRWSSQFTFTNLYTPRQNNLKSHHCNLIISFVSVWISLKLIVSSWSIQRETSTEFGILTLQRASMGLSDSRETAKKFSRQA